MLFYLLIEMLFEIHQGYLNNSKLNGLSIKFLHPTKEKIQQLEVVSIKFKNSYKD